MFRLRKFLSLMAVPLIGAAILAAPSQAHATFTLQIRATEYTGTGSGAPENSTATATSSGPSPLFTSANLSLADFSINIVTSILTSGTGMLTGTSTTINMTWNGTNPGNTVLVEVLATMLAIPPGGPAAITSNASPSTSGLAAASVTMTSGVMAGTSSLNPEPGTALGATPLAGQLGMTTGTGSMGSASSVLVPNPATNGGVFMVPTGGYSFYQTFNLNTFSMNGGPAGSLSSGSQVVPVPAPAGLVLLVSGLPALGGFQWLRRRKTVKAA